MKKIIAIAACTMLAVAVQAASIGWTVAAGNSTYANDKYMVFVIGQNGVTGVDQIVAILNAGNSVSSYAFGEGTLNASGLGSVTAAKSGKTITPTEFPATLTSFAVIFDSASPESGKTSYALISGQKDQVKELANSSSGSATFATGNVSSILSNSKNWSSYGPVPEPCTVALLAVGLAAFGLKRKIA